ncbi:MAG: SDR family oxidoreductase [Chloroflexota bacterium]|nr:SDR family oxidoreductase [Chloroflexota bacterium]MDE3101418.1 SDR family oxidoreductase [Chloroflexota bacterium]
MIVLVTGAAGAIGSATVDAFLARGDSVVGLDREATAPRPRYLGLRVDLADAAAADEAIARAAGLGPIAHVVAVAGGALPWEPAAGDPGLIDVAAFRASVDANLVTQFTTLRAALSSLRASTDAHRSVAFTSSFNALGGWGMPAYSAAKAGLIGLMRALVAPLGRDGIRVNVVAPGTVRTPRTERIWAHDPSHFADLTARSALGRLATPADVAVAYVSLATVLTHVTGQVLVVDGGQMVPRV